MGQKRTDSWLGHSNAMWETGSNLIVLQSPAPCTSQYGVVRASMFFMLSFWLLLLKSCKRYQLSCSGEQEEILKSSKYLWYGKTVLYSALYLSCKVHNPMIIKSQLVMGYILIIQRIFISKWSCVAIILFSGLCAWTELINWFLHPPEHRVV